MNVNNEPLGCPVVVSEDDETRVCYLVLHLGVPSDGVPARRRTDLRGVVSAQLAGECLDIAIRPVRLVWEVGKGSHRYLFHFSGYARNDRRARTLGESLFLALSLTWGPFLSPEDLETVFRFPARLAHRRRTIDLEHLEQVEEARPFDERIAGSPWSGLRGATTIADAQVDMAWKIVPILFRHAGLHRAAAFLKESQNSFYLFPGQINEVIYGEPQTPETISVQTRLENALHNAFKAVEAVIGDPPKDERRLDAKLQAIGLDPKAWVGYKNAQPLHSVIRKMSEARDKKAAHGSTPDRAIALAEMLEFQACARLLVWAAVEKEHGTPIQLLPAWFEDAMADEYRRAHPEIGL